MTSKLETSYSGMFLDTKLKTVLDNLNKELIETRLSTKEDISALFNKVLREYYVNLHKSIFQYKEINKGNDPDLDKLNNDIFAIYNDLRILYSSMKRVRNLLGSNYNGLSGLSLKIKSDIGKISSNLIDYRIQNTNKFEPSFQDSFFNLSKVEVNEGKYTKAKAFVDTFNSNVVLPLDKEAENIKVKRVQIGQDSVGTSGNNQELNSIARDNIKLAVDGSIDTWFEFEQVGSSELELPTVLNIRMEFEEEAFFNLLDVSSVQFPNGSYPAIMDIRGSTDGSTFFDLKSLYLGEVANDSIGNSIIQLGENPNNPNDGNLLYFIPRKIKFLVIKFIEDSSYFIKTSSGIKYRRAIGIKELKPKSQKFKNEGQFITTNFLSNTEISKIALFTKEYFPSNFTSTFNYFISVDDGQNWKEISPSQRIKDKIPEILSFNIDYLEGSTKTDFPVASVKLKTDFKIEENADATTITSSYTQKPKTEFTNLASGSKVINVQEKPFGAVNIYKTNYGSVGKDSFFKLANSSLRELEDRFILQLPIAVFPSESIQVDQEELLIDNYTWTRVESIDSADLATAMVYQFDYLNNIITFNKLIASDRHGKKPSTDILFKLKRENIKIITAEIGHVLKTKLPHDAIKENISIYQVDENPTVIGFKLRNLASVHRLGVEEINSINIITDLNNILDTEKVFINGVIELKDAGDYSIDYKRGVIFTFTVLDGLEEVLIEVSHRKKIPLVFDLNNGILSTTADIIKSNKTFNITTTVDSYVLDLGFKNIEARSVLFTNLPASMTTEVLYENMESEFNAVGTTGKYAIDYAEGILYLQNKTQGLFSGTLVNTNYYAEYNVSYKIPETAYSVIASTKTIEFSDKFVSDFFNSSSNEILSPSLMKIEYTYAQEIKESTSELFPYTTPFIMEYKIITTPKESL